MYCRDADGWDVRTDRSLFGCMAWMAYIDRHRFDQPTILPRAERSTNRCSACVQRVHVEGGREGGRGHWVDE